MEQKKKLIVNFIYYGIILVAVFLAVKWLVPALFPFIIAFVIALLLRKPSVWLAERFNLNQKGTSLAVTLVFYLIFVLAVLFLGKLLFGTLINVIRELPSLYTNQIEPLIQELIIRLEKATAAWDIDILGQIDTYLNDLTRTLGQNVSEISVKVMGTVSSLVKKVPGAFLNVIITAVASFFIVGDYEKIKELFQKIMPQKAQNICNNVKGYTGNVIFAYVKSYLLLMSITFAELFVGLMLFRIPYAGWIALAISIFDILPILGTGGIVIPWALIACLLGNYTLAVQLFLLYIVILIVRNILEPRVVGKQIGVHPLATLITMFLGLRIFGIWGMIGMPVALVVLVNAYKNGVFVKKEETGDT